MKCANLLFGWQKLSYFVLFHVTTTNRYGDCSDIMRNGENIWSFKIGDLKKRTKEKSFFRKYTNSGN